MCELIGSGTYGTVYRIDDDTALKEMKKLYKKTNGSINLEDASIREICFLSQYSHPNIPTLKDVKFSNSKVNMYMTYGGITLTTWAFEQKYKKDHHQLPLIIFQIISVLYYLEQLGFIHGDLKPANIVLNPITFRVLVIDWGNVHFDLRYQNGSLCTKNFTPPEAHHNEINLRHDVFSIGLCVKFFESCRYETVDYIKLCYKKEGSYPLSDIISEEFTEVVKTMLIYDPEKRASPRELFFSPVFDIYRKSGNHISNVYPTRFNITLPIIDYSKHSIDKNDRRLLLSWYYIICDKNAYLNLYMLTSWIADKYLTSGKVPITKDNYELLLVSCIGISSSILATSITTMKLQEISNNQFTVEEINKFVWIIIEDLKGSIYRKTIDQQLSSPNMDLIRYLTISEELKHENNKQLLSRYHNL